MKTIYCAAILALLALAVYQAEAAPSFPADFDGDHITDFAVWRPTNGTWYVLLSSGATCAAVPPLAATGYGGCQFQWGLIGDKPMIGDFDSDGRTDFTVFRPSNRQWYIYMSSGGAVIPTFPNYPQQPGDISEILDINNDNRSDMAYFRPSDGYYYIRTYNAGTGQITVTRYYLAINTYGVPNDPLVPISANYQSASPKEEAALFLNEPYYGNPFMTWAAMLDDSTTKNLFYRLLFDSLNYEPVRGNFGGAVPSLGDFVVFNRITGVWKLSFNTSSTEGTFTNVNWGLSGDKPVSGDYDGDGMQDIVVFRPNEGGSGFSRWYFLPSAQSGCPRYTSPTGYGSPPYTLGCFVNWGLQGDIPVGSHY